MYDLKFEIDENILKAIAKSIADGIGVDFVHNKKQFNTFTNNSTYSMIWDLINTNCNKNLGANFICQVIKKKRGMWEFLLIFDRNSKKIITIMRENRLKQILKHPEKYIKHYVAALAQYLNIGLESNQTKLFNYTRTDEEEKYLSELSRELCQEINSDFLQDSLYAILSFNSSDGLMTGFKSTFLTKNLELSNEKSLQSYIPKDYDMINNANKTEEIKDIPLSFKPAAIEKKQAKTRKNPDLIEVKQLEHTKDKETKEE